MIFESEETTLNMPFLGFYGDYNSLKPYEDFSFEKDPNKVYESDIMDDYLRENYNLTNAYTGSYFLIGDNEKYYSPLTKKKAGKKVTALRVGEGALVAIENVVRLDAVLSNFDARGDYDVALPPLPARGDGQPALSHGYCARIWPAAARRD